MRIGPDAVSSLPRTTETIGFIGLGAFGAPIVRRLAGLGHAVVVNDINPGAVQAAVACGAVAAATPAAVASAAELVFTCLPSLPALRQVVLGDDGLCAGTVIRFLIDLSTTGATFARDLAAELQRRGIQMLDSPVTGNVAKAADGALGVMCSGPRTAFEAAESVMAGFASQCILYLGEESGRAQTLKSLNNLLSATGMAVSCEAVIIGVKAGLDPAIILDVLNGGDASNNATRNKFASSILTRRFDFGARMAITSKDISTTIDEAEARGVPMWIGQSVKQIWRYAVSQGGGDLDGTALITFLERWAGVEVRARSPVAALVAEDPPVLAGDMPPLVLLCRPAFRDPLAARLRQAGWRPEAGGDCTLVPVEQEQAARDALPHGRCLVINACLMSARGAAALADAVEARDGLYVDALPPLRQRDWERGVRGLLISGSTRGLRLAEPFLAAIGAPLCHVSDRPGAAHLMQQIETGVFATLLAASCEAYVTGAKAGLELATMLQILGIETGRNAASARILPEEVATGRFDDGISIRQLCHSLALLSEAAEMLALTPWVLDKTRLLYRLAAQLGAPQDDVTRLARYYEGWAGVEVRYRNPG